MIQAAWKVSDWPFDPIRHDQPRNRLVHPLGVPGADAGAVEGLIFGPTGAAMSPTHTRKGNRLYRYYVSQDVLKRGPEACPIGRVPSAEIEAAVIDQLRGIFRQPEIIVATWRAARGEQDDITEDEAREALLQPDPLWGEMFPAEQAKACDLRPGREVPKPRCPVIGPGG